MATETIQKPGHLDIITYQGDTWRRTFTFEEDGVAKNLSTFTFSAQLRRTATDSTSVAFAIDHTNKATGVIILSLADDVTDALIGDYVWDFQWTTAGGETTTIIEGTLTVKPEVSR